jgi:hypothetical protein
MIFLPHLAFHSYLIAHLSCRNYVEEVAGITHRILKHRGDYDRYDHDLTSELTRLVDDLDYHEKRDS